MIVTVNRKNQPILKLNPSNTALQRQQKRKVSLHCRPMIHGANQRVRLPHDTRFHKAEKTD